jgi:hypothetical protein
MRRMTTSEATQLLEEAWNTAPDTAGSGLVEAYVLDVDVTDATSDVESYIASLPEMIDPDTVTITPDNIEDWDVHCVRVAIKTED